MVTAFVHGSARAGFALALWCLHGVHTVAAQPAAEPAHPVGLARPPLLVLLPPQAPTQLYRIAMRTPEDVFSSGFLPPSENREDVDADAPVSDDLLMHLVRPDRSQASTWTSLSTNRDDLRFRMNVLGRVSNPPPRIWTYTVRATPAGYSLYWALSEYALRHRLHPTERSRAAEFATSMYGVDSIWSVQGRIAASDIVRAAEYEFVPERRGYRFTGVWRSNPNYVGRPRPERSQRNPIDQYDTAPGAIHLYATSVPAARPDRGSVHVPVVGTLHCLAAVPRPSHPPPQSMQSRHVLPVAAQRPDQGCDPGSDGFRRLTPSTAHGSVLAFRIGDRTACLQPESSSGYIGNALAACSASSPLFEYDDQLRLATVWQQNRWCLTAPSSVLEGNTPRWDYAQFLPCAVNDPAQKWALRDGRIYSFRGDYALQHWSGRAMLSSQEDGQPMLFATERFAPGFFDGPSPSRSPQVELKLGWSWKGGTYYSNTNGSAPWDYGYRSRSYYDYALQTISYLNPNDARPGRPPMKYCLRSRQAESRVHDWDWTEWVPCNDTEPRSPFSSRWAMDLREANRDPDSVTLRDATGKPLWVVAHSNQNGGFYFTARDDQLDYSSTSARRFSIWPDAVRFGPEFHSKE